MAKKINPKINQVEKELIPKKFQNIVFVSLLSILVLIFLGDGISSKGGFGAQDNIASQSFETYKKAAQDNDEFPLWIPYVFGGMPAYQSLMLTGDRYWDIPPKIVFGFGELIREIFGSDVARMAFYYILYGIGFFYFLNNRGMDKYISFICSFSAIFSTAIITWVVIGHNTKPVVMAMLPFTLLAYDKLKEKFSFLWVALSVIILHIMLEGSHLQMIFYCAFLVGIYVIVDIVSGLKSNDNVKGILRAVGIFAIASGLAFAMSADRYMSTLEYTPYSTRGSAPTLESQNTAEKSSSGGNTYEYASQYSFSPGEMITFVAPYYYGFGKVSFKSDKPNSILNQMTGNGERELYTYWGQKEIEDTPPYMGIIIFAFAIFGLVTNRKNKFVVFLAISGLFFLLLSFGKNFDPIFNLLFYNFPSFNKFRAPSMSLAMLQMIMPILAAFGFKTVFNIKNGDANEKLLKYFLYAAGGFLLIALIFAAGMKGFYFNSVNGMKFLGNNLGAQMNQLDPNMVKSIETEYKTFLFESTYKDLIINGALLLLSVFASFLYTQNKLSKTLWIAGLFLFSIIDLWRVGYRNHKPEEQNLKQNYFQKFDYVDFLQKEQKNDIFRISDGFRGQNIPAYFELENVGGYHAAKLRVYQDLLDAAAGGNTSRMYNPFMWSLLNVKYVIEQRPLPGFEIAFESNTGVKVLKNPVYLPRVFFVDEAIQKDNKEVLQMIKNNQTWNPLEIAYLEKMPNNSIDKPEAQASAKIIEKGFHKMKIDVNATGNNLLYISEIYYPEGWSATLDGEPIEILRANFGFRAIEVPQGKHTIEMKYSSDAFETGRTLSGTTNFIVAILLGVGLFMKFKRKK